MKWPLLFLLAFLPFALAAQKEIPLPKDTLVLVDSILGRAKFLGIFGKAQFQSTLGKAQLLEGKKNQFKIRFEHDDRIQFSFQEAKGEGITQLKVRVDSTNFVATVLDKPVNTGLVELPVHTGSDYTFRLINRVLLWPKSRRYAMGIWKTIEQAPTLPLEDFVTFDTSWLYFTDTLITLDTFWLPLLDQTVTIQPERDLHAVPRSLVELTLPAEVDRWYYWLGVGPEAITHYAQWAEALDTETSSPLHAFAKGTLPDLPVSGSGNRINYSFTENNGHKLFLSTSGVTNVLSSGKNVRAAYQQLPKKSAFEEQKFLCLENAEAVSNINVMVKVLGRSIKSTITPFPDSTLTHIQARIQLDTTDKTREEQEHILQLYKKSIDAARNAREKYPVSYEQINRQLDTVELQYLYPEQLAVPGEAVAEKSPPSEQEITGTERLPQELLLQQIDTVREEIKPLPNIVNNDRSFQILRVGLNTITPKIDHIEVSVEALLKEDTLPVENRDSIRELAQKMEEVLSDIIGLESEIVRLQNQARQKQILQTVILSDGVMALHNDLNKVGNVPNATQLEAINEAIDRMEYAVDSLKAEQLDDRPGQVLNQQQQEQILKDYEKIKELAKNIRKDIVSASQENTIDSQRKDQWVRELRDLQTALRDFLRNHTPVSGTGAPFD